MGRCYFQQRHEGGLLDNESSELQDSQAATQEAPSDAPESSGGNHQARALRGFQRLLIVDVEGRAEQMLPLTEALPEPLKKK